MAASPAAQRRREKARENWRAFTENKAGLVGLGVLGMVVLLALLVPVLIPAQTLAVTGIESGPNQPPSGEHWLGTDPLGRDIFAMLLWGARVSLMVGVTATLMSVVIGTTVGMLAGHFGGWVQVLLLRVIDFFIVIPSLVLAITLSTILERGALTIIIAIGVTSWAGTARIVRSQTLTIEARGYVERSQALGAGHAHILGRHVLPAVMPIVLANTTLAVGSAIIAESTLSFLGLGDPNMISWGSLLKTAMDTGAATAGYWWFVLPPGIAIVMVVLCFTLVGRALEAVVNPTLRGR